MIEGIIIKALSGFYYVAAGERVIDCKARGRFRLTVNPRAITVESNGDKVEYDGKLHTVTGFKTLEFTAGGNTFTVSGLTASGAEGTDAGNYENVITGTAVVADADGDIGRGTADKALKRMNFFQRLKFFFYKFIICIYFISLFFFIISL